MALTIDPALKRVTIPQSDLTLLSGSLYDFDTNQFRLDLGALLDDEAYIWMPLAFTHNTEVTVLGVVYARQILMINGWSLTFQNIAMSVQYSGSNNDLFDSENGILINQPLVNVIGNNSAGLTTVTSGSGLSAAQDTKLTEMHNDHGLNLATDKTVTENTVDTDYPEVNAYGVTKTVKTVGAVTTIDRTV